ncbi:MAG: helix-turn-helix transcriptional regulator [Sphingobium sp.]
MASRAVEQDWENRFLSAALEPDRWDDALRAMAAATGSRHGQLIGFGPGAVPFNWITDSDASMAERSDQIDISAPDLNFRVAADRLSDLPSIVHEAHYDIARAALRADDYLDLCDEFDIFDGCQTRLLADDRMMIGLALLRDSKDGRTSEEDRALFARIAGQARKAVRLQQAIEQQGFALLSGTLEAMDRACFLIDAMGRVGGATPRAEGLLSTGSLRLVDGQLSTARPDDARRIAASIRGVIEPPRMGGDPVTLADAAGNVAMMLEFHALPSKAWALPFAPRGIIVARTGVPTDRTIATLMQSYRLTVAEADIAVRLASGMSRPDIAAARGVSVETLKVQLRSVYEKMGCNRESQVVRLVGLFSH